MKKHNLKNLAPKIATNIKQCGNVTACSPNQPSAAILANVFGINWKKMNEANARRRKRRPIGALGLYDFLTWSGRCEDVKKAMKALRQFKKPTAEIHFDKDVYPDGVICRWKY